MATVTGMTAARMLEIEGQSIVSGSIIGGNLILTRQNGTSVNAGPVVGAAGATGPSGAPGVGVPVGGAPGQVLAKLDSTDYNTQWVDQTGGSGGAVPLTEFPLTLGVALSDESSVITTGVKNTIRAPWAFTLTEVRATASISGTTLTTIDVKNSSGTSIFGANKLTIDANEKTSKTAATGYSLSQTAIPDDEELSFEVVGVATALRGLKIWLIGTRNLSGTTTIPSQVGSVVVTPGNGSVGLSWTAPSNGGSPITGYAIQGSINGGVNWSVITTNTGNTNTTATVTTYNGTTALINGTTYQFRVAAINALGVGAYSAGSNGTPRTVPGSPTSLAATPGSEQVSLTWTAPAANGGSAITDYLVEYKLTSGSTWSTFSDSVSTVGAATVTGLTNNSSYDFRVSAINVAGTGTPSSTTSATPVSATGLGPGSYTLSPTLAPRTILSVGDPGFFDSNDTWGEMRNNDVPGELSLTSSFGSWAVGVTTDILSALNLCQGWQTLFEFDTVLQSGRTITAATLTFTLVADDSTTDFAIEARKHDFGSTIEPADWVRGIDLASKPLMGTLSTSGIGAVNEVKTITLTTTDFVTTAGGKTRIVLSPDYLRTQSASPAVATTSRRVTIGKDTVSLNITVV